MHVQYLGCEVHVSEMIVLIGMRDRADGEGRDGDPSSQQNDADWPAP